MDIIAHEERLVATGLKLEQAREIIRVVVASDANAMTRVDGVRLEQKIDAKLSTINARLDVIMRRFDVIASKFANNEGKFEAINSKIDAMTNKLVATAWTVGGVAVGILTAIRYLG